MVIYWERSGLWYGQKQGTASRETIGGYASLELLTAAAVEKYGDGIQMAPATGRK